MDEHDENQDEYGDQEDQDMEFDPSQLDEEQLAAYYAMHGQMQDEDEEDEEGDEVDQEEYADQMRQDEVDQSPRRQQFSMPSPSNRMRESSSPGVEQVDIDETLRRIRRDLLDNLNKARKEKKLGPLYFELMPQVVADRYAGFLLDTDHDYNEFKRLLEFYRYVEKGLGDCHLIHIESKYEEDTTINPDVMYEYFMEMGYLFLEVESDRKILLSPEMNHISIGITADESQIIIVYIVSKRDLCITKVEDGHENNIIIHGKMLDDTVGVYALQILPFQDQGKPPDKNDNNKVGPEFIDFDKQTRQFIARIPNQGGGCSYDIRQFIDIYTRNTPESIPYKKQTRDKLNLKHLELKLRVPVVAYPDPRFAHEEEQAKQRQEAEDMLLQETPVLQEDNHQTNQDEAEESEKEDQRLESDAFIAKKFEIPKEQQISNKDIREELDIAIAEAQRQHDELYDHNVNLQQKIKQIRNKQEVYADKNNEMTMNEHKYLNTLAHVHQIRLDLQQTQDRYNEMAAELQKKLDEKSKKCNEIRQAFMELKREVARKASFSRTDKPIPEHKILEWEEFEMQKNKSLQELRLDTLRLKNTLAKNQKQLKKKEELAEGLHLIDFEQLKIENQTLNEKIEERTEDLHKLKNKNTKTVQVLTHTREKLGFVKAKFSTQEASNAEKKKELDILRDQLGKYKGSKDALRNDNLKLKQQTGIVNRPELIEDYLNRKKRIEELRIDLGELEQQLRQMQIIIEKYNAYVKTKQQSQTNKQKVKLF